MARVPRWRIDDVLDLEAAFLTDSDRDEDRLAGRDRAIFTETVRRLGRDLSGSDKVRSWVEARRASTDGPRVGQNYRAAAGLLSWGLALVGASIGGGLAGSLLFFDGGRPISVTVFLSVTVVWQIIVWGALVAAMIFGRPAGGVIAAGLGRLLRWLGERNVEGAGRASFAAVWGELRAKRMIYGDVLVWPVVRAAQVFAIALNVGILAVTLWLVVISNRGFGWETTLDVSPETALRIVEGIAWPWSSLPNAHPSLPEIADSRIAMRTAGEYNVDSAAAWWPFLAYAVAFYGLLPRIGLLGVAVVMERRALGRLDFRQAECARLLRRMEPVVVAGDVPPERPAGPKPAAAAPLAGGEVVAVVSHELQWSDARVEAALAGLGMRAVEVLAAEVDCAEANADVFARLGVEGRAVAVVIDGSRPPVKAILEFLRRLREVRGERGEIVMIPVAVAGSAFPYDAAWRAAVAALADPYLRVERA